MTPDGDDGGGRGGFIRGDELKAMEDARVDGGRSSSGMSDKTAPGQGAISKKAGTPPPQVVHRIPDDTPTLDIQGVVLDLETTGLTPKRHNIIEVAYIRYDGPGITPRRRRKGWSSLVYPFQSIRNSNIHGIFDTDVEEAPPFSRLSRHLLKVFSGTLLVGHNLRTFDMKFLRTSFDRVGVGRIEVDALDTLILARRMLPHLPSKGLEALSKAFKVETPPTHRALADVLATCEVLTHLLRMASDAGHETAGDLRRLGVIKDVELASGVYDMGYFWEYDTKVRDAMAGGHDVAITRSGSAAFDGRRVRPMGFGPGTRGVPCLYAYDKEISRHYPIPIETIADLVVLR